MRADLLSTKMATAGNCTLDHSQPTHRHTARLCISHLCAPFITTIFAVNPRPPARVTACPFFLKKAAELKRFRSHSLAQQSPGDEQEALNTEELEELHGALLTQIPRTNRGGQPICRRLPKGPQSHDVRTNSNLHRPDHFRRATVINDCISIGVGP